MDQEFNNGLEILVTDNKDGTINVQIVRTEEKEGRRRIAEIVDGLSFVGGVHEIEEAEEKYSSRLNTILKKGGKPGDIFQDTYEANRIKTRELLEKIKNGGRKRT